MQQNLFWGTVVKPNESITQRGIPAYHISNVSLDIDTIAKGEKCQLWIRCNHTDYLIATLCSRIPQVKVDLAMGHHEKSKLYTKGNGTVYLSGFYIPTDEKEDTVADVERKSSRKKQKGNDDSKELVRKQRRLNKINMD